MTEPVAQIVVMGVSGCGKSTLARRLAAELDWDFIEGDRHHPQSNIDRMSAGQALTDDDRAPWLASLAAMLAQSAERGRPCVLACSALKRSYRDTFRAGGGRVRFVHLHGDRALIERRLKARRGHFFQAGLLESQLDTLEPVAGEDDGITLDIVLSVDAQMRAVLQWMKASVGEPGQR